MNSADTNIVIKVKNLSSKLEKTPNLELINYATRLYYNMLRINVSKFSKSGKLLSSWKYYSRNRTESVIYSDMVYARIQDKGGKIRITRKMRNFAWYQYRKTKNTMWKRIAITKKMFITMPSKNYSNMNTAYISRLINQRYGN